MLGTLPSAFEIWSLVSRLGEAQLLLPLLLSTAWILIHRGLAPRMAIFWVSATLATAVVTAFTKIGFIGFEVGYAPLDYTGISGHSMFAAAILPLVGRVAEGSFDRRWHPLPTIAGLIIALLVAVSRIELQAHSWSEVIAGFLVGGCVSLSALILVDVPRLRIPLWIPIASLIWLMAAAKAAPPSQTHGLVTEIALHLSGREQPYKRWQMHRKFRQDLRRKQPDSVVGLGIPPAGRSD